MSKQIPTFVMDLLPHEGGYTADPDDRGNWTGGAKNVGELKGTKFGIAAHAHPNLDIKNLTLEQAAEIYAEDYYYGPGYDKLPASIRQQVFDMGVNHGPAAANRMLQEVAGVTVDGKLGPETLAAAAGVNPNALADRRVAYYEDLIAGRPSLAKYEKGWLRRANSFRVKDLSETQVAEAPSDDPFVQTDGAAPAPLDGAVDPQTPSEVDPAPDSSSDAAVLSPTESDTLLTGSIPPVHTPAAPPRRPEPGREALPGEFVVAGPTPGQPGPLNPLVQQGKNKGLTYENMLATPFFERQDMGDNLETVLSDELTASAMRRYDAARAGAFQLDPGYIPQVEQMRKHPEIAEQIAMARSQAEADWLVSDYKRASKNRQTLAQSDANLSLFIGALADPVNLGSVLLPLGAVRGAGALKGALGATALSGGTLGVYEFARSELNAGVTGSEALINTAIGAGLVGGMGALVGRSLPVSEMGKLWAERTAAGRQFAQDMAEGKKVFDFEKLNEPSGLRSDAIMSEKEARSRVQDWQFPEDAKLEDPHGAILPVVRLFGDRLPQDTVFYRYFKGSITREGDKVMPVSKAPIVLDDGLKGFEYAEIEVPAGAVGLDVSKLSDAIPEEGEVLLEVGRLVELDPGSNGVRRFRYEPPKVDVPDAGERATLEAFNEAGKATAVTRPFSPVRQALDAGVGAGLTKEAAEWPLRMGGDSSWSTGRMQNSAYQRGHAYRGKWFDAQDKVFEIYQNQHLAKKGDIGLFTQAATEANQGLGRLVGRKMPGGKLRLKDFNDLVTRAVAGDKALDVDSVPGLRAASEIHRKALDDMWEIGQEAGVFPGVKSARKNLDNIERRIEQLKENLRLAKKAETQDRLLRQIDDLEEQKAIYGELASNPLYGKPTNYVPRFWRIDKILKNEEAFKKILFDYFRSKPYRDVIVRSKDPETGAWLAKTERQYMSSDPAAISKRVDEAVEQIKGEAETMDGEGMLPRNRGKGGPRFTAQRQLDIPDNLVLDFIETDSSFVLRNYMDRMGPWIEMAKELDGRTFDDLVDDLYTEGLEKLGNGSRAKFEKNFNKFRQNMGLVHDRVVGNIMTRPDALDNRIGKVIRDYSTLTFMGAAAIASLPEIARASMVGGMSRSWGVLADGMIDTKQMKLAVREVQISGEALDIVIGMAHKRFAEDAIFSGERTAAERFLEKSQAPFFMITGLSPLTAVTKMFAGVVGQHVFMEAIENAAKGKATKKELSFLADYGFTEADIKLIATMPYERSDSGRLVFANTDAWGKGGDPGDPIDVPTAKQMLRDFQDTEGGLKGREAKRPDQDKMVSLVRQHGKPLERETVLWRGHGPEGFAPPGNKVVSTSRSKEAAKKFAVASGEKAMEEGEAVPVAEIIMPKGAKVMDVNENPGTLLPSEEEFIIERGRLTKGESRIEDTRYGLFEVTTYRWEADNAVDPAAAAVREKFRAALGSYTRNVIPTPGPADKPWIADGNFINPRTGEREHSNLVGLPTQFWSYGFGAMQRVFHGGMVQQRDQSLLGGIIAMSGLGYMAASLKTPDFAWDEKTPIDKMYRAAEYSGLFGTLGDMPVVAQNAIGGVTGVNIGSPLGIDFKYGEPNGFDSVGEILGAGPSIGLNVVEMLTNEDLTSQERKGMAYRSMLFNNGVWWRDYFRQVGDGVARTFE